MNQPALLSLLVFASCATRIPSWQHADPETWQSLRQYLEAERAARPRQPWTAQVSVWLREPQSGRVVDGRGAMAVAPGRALRMILVGAAGETMLDAWVTTDRWRVAVPLAGQVRRGQGSSEERDREDARDLPVGFLRWLFFTTLRGTLFAGKRERDDVLLMLRDREAVLEVRLGTCDRGRLATTTRRVRGRVERLDECRASSVPQPGDWARYRDEGTRLQVDLSIESVASQPPDDLAFRDPDAGGEVAP